MTVVEPDVQQLVMQELGSMLETLDRVGAEYARQYLRHVTRGERMPRVPLCLPRGVAKDIREIVLDAAMMERVRGASLIPTPAQSEVSSDGNR